MISLIVALLLTKSNRYSKTDLEAVTADSGYCREKKLLYLKEKEIKSLIKLQDHEKRETRTHFL